MNPQKIITKNMTVSIPSDLLEKLNKKAKKEDRPKSRIVRDALKTHLAKDD
jgi:metal-responsive CopG/Arc/MetJ family transcriptional regulator